MMRILLDEPEVRVAPTRKHASTENFGDVFASWIRSLTFFRPFLVGLTIVQNQPEATHRATSGILCSLSHQRLTNIYLERFLDLTTEVPRTPKINQRMDHYPAQPSGENLGAEEKTLRRKGIVLAVVGALLIVLAVLDGWPVV
jgi:hypothetical protein